MVRQVLLTPVRRAIPVMAVLIGLAAAAGCRGPLEVTTIQLGRSLNSDNSVGTHTTLFKPDETMYVSVITGAAGSGTIVARWLYAGRVVSEATKNVSYRDQAATEFHMQNTNGFPPGEYSVEILIDAMPVGTRAFRVQE